MQAWDKKRKNSLKVLWLQSPEQQKPSFSQNSLGIELKVRREGKLKSRRKQQLSLEKSDEKAGLWQRRSQLTSA